MYVVSILNSVLVLGTLGLIFGAILAYASKKFAVDVDERVESIIEVLPGANCGGCGFPGCGGLANAIVEGKAAVNACPVGGEICATKIGDIMGISYESEEKQVAKVLCKGNCKSAKDKTNVTAAPIPIAVSTFLDTPKKGHIPINWEVITLFILPPGAFLSLGFLLAGFNKLRNKKA